MNIFHSSQTLPYLQLYPISSHYQLKPTLYQKKTTPFLLAMQMKVVWFRYCKHQPSSSSLKHKEWHSLIKELGLDRVTNVIP